MIQATKEKESKEILANITVDKVHHSKAQDDEQQLQLIPTNPKERVINSPILLLKTQVPNLPVILHQEEPGTGSKQIAKLNPCDVPNLREMSVHSGFQDQFTMVDIKKLSKFVRKFAADFYPSAFNMYPPSAPIKPALKPPWNLYKDGTVGTTAPGNSVPEEEIQDEFSQTEG